ncbi:hypothetical protein BCR34DRAFT_563775 [Clohesyomyces aquaticus]|uniref:LysM domain-containing protein n=1 Tax=Clohesyomyces aquaticus TaxID=1231657 RepID=A0A1Y1ZQC2_9PLEO|nr:hypothetical protein BCR34DRAFT_563775 [Clohesyomyces aquaticus]
MIFGRNGLLILLTLASAGFARTGGRLAVLNKRQGFVEDCTYTLVAIDSDTCQTLADFGSITVDQFKAYNPQVTDCDALVVGNEYCLEKNWGAPDPVSTTSSSSKTSSVVRSTSKKPTSATPIATPTKSVGVTPPAPTQSGVAANCNKWDVIQDGDTCSVYLAKNPGVTLANLVAWNPAIGTQCTNLWIGSAICVSVTGFVPKTTVVTKPTTTPKPTTAKGTTKAAVSSIKGAVPPPGPTQAGVVANCNRWGLIKSDTTCATIIKNHPGLTLAKLVSWNPAIGDTCTNLWLDYYVCTGVVGWTDATSTKKPASSTKKPTSTKKVSSTKKPTATSTVPSPVQSGINSKCKKYHKVVKGNTCYDLATKYKIELANFYKWNPSVKTDCSGLWVDYYVCVGV